MRFDEFVENLNRAGWKGVRDAQHSHIYDFWRQIFPVIAELESEISELQGDIGELQHQLREIEV